MAVTDNMTLPPRGAAAERWSDTRASAQNRGGGPGTVAGQQDRRYGQVPRSGGQPCGAWVGVRPFRLAGILARMVLLKQYE
jgi:hypothetical protein